MTDLLNWRSWNVDYWNEMLFQHFFLVDETGSAPVTRLVITKTELALIATGSRSPNDEVTEAFLSAIRCSPSNLRFLLTCGAHKGWEKKSIPPFFVYLAFTCYIAAVCDESLLDTGDFRDRLQEVMQHAEGTNYQLNDLKFLWVNLAKWLSDRRSSGLPFRELILPDPRHRTLIGYSVELSFPARSDFRRLVQVFKENKFDAEPTVVEAMQKVGPSINDFGQSFREAYEIFRRSCLSSVDSSRESPFWSAVKEAWAVSRDTLTKIEPKIHYSIIVETDQDLRDSLVVVSSSCPEREIPNFMFVEVQASLTDFHFVLCGRGSNGPDPELATEALLDGIQASIIQGLGLNSLAATVDLGIIFFARNGLGLRQFVLSIPDDGRIWMLVKLELVEDFLNGFPTHCRPRTKVAKYTGWIEIADVDVSILWSLRDTWTGSLARALGFQTVGHTDSIRVIGGLSVDGGWLGLHGYLPAIATENVDEVIAYRLASGRLESIDESSCLQLERSADHLERFNFPTTRDQVFDGTYLIVTRLKGNVTGQRTIVFRRNSLVTQFKQPSDPTAWLVEAGGPDVRQSDWALLRGDSLDLGTTDFTSVERSKELLEQFIRNRPPGPSTRLPLSTVCQQFTTTDQVRWECFSEVCAFLANRRSGISEADFIELVGQSFNVQPQRLVWEIVRSWIEIGCFDKLVNRRWRGARYFARPPRLVIWCSGGLVHASVIGLLTEAIRNKLLRYAELSGAVTWPTDTLTQYAPPLLSWSAGSVGVFESMCEQAELPPPGWLPNFRSITRPMALITKEICPPPINYAAYGSWAWEEGHFVRERPVAQDRIGVAWLRRPDAPDCFAVTRRGTQTWWSHSRNWALLAAYNELDRQVFRNSGAAGLERCILGQIYLPVPLARYVAIVSRNSPGPAISSSGSSGYNYLLRDSEERMVVRDLLWSSVQGAPAQLSRQVKWMSALAIDASKHSVDALIFMPTDLRRWLCTQGLPEATKLAETRVPPWLIPHIRQLASKGLVAQSVPSIRPTN